MTINPIEDLQSPLRDIAKNVASVSAAKVYSLAITAVMVMIVARWLGPAGQGIMAASTAWATLFATLGSLSLGQVAIHRATVRRGEEWIGETMGTLLVLAVLITVACWVAAALVYAVSGGSIFGSVPMHALMVGFLLVPFLVWEFYGAALLTASDRIDIYNRAQFIGRSVGIVLMMVCWLMRLSVVAAIGISIVSQMIVSCTGIRALWVAAGGKVRATLAEARALLRGALQLHVNTISTYVYTSLGVLIVNRYCGAEETGWYQFAIALVNVILVIPMGTALVLSARVARFGPEQAWASQRKVFIYLPLIMILVCVVAAIAAPTAIPLVVGNKYIPAVPLFRASLFGIFGVTVAAVMMSQWIGRGYFWQMSVISVVVATIHLTLTLVLVRRYGMYGAVYANVIFSVISMVNNAIFALVVETRYRASIARAAAEENAVTERVS